MAARVSEKFRERLIIVLITVLVCFAWSVVQGESGPLIAARIVVVTAMALGFNVLTHWWRARRKRQ